MRQKKNNKPQDELAAINFMIGIMIVMLIAIILLVSVRSCSAKKRTKELGYLVYTTTTELNKVHRVKDLAVVYGAMQLRFPDLIVNLEKELKRSRYFQILTEMNGIYVERVWLIKRRNGKYRSKRLKDNEVGLI